MPRAIIAVPFFDTAENERSAVTIEVLTQLLEVVPAPHVVIPVNNGSSDRAAVEFARGEFPHFLDLAEPLSISGGVNSAWHLFHDELQAGEAVAFKHDNDLRVTPTNWVDTILEFIDAHPDVYLVGVRNVSVDYADWPHLRGDMGSWYETIFTYGGLQARSPACFAQIGYARQPYGRWGWGDHWDSWRVMHLGKRLAVLKDFEFQQLVGHSSLPDADKQEHHDRARGAYLDMRAEVVLGKREIYEPWPQ
jgi:hypothetical protein